MHAAMMPMFCSRLCLESDLRSSEAGENTTYQKKTASGTRSPSRIQIQRQSYLGCVLTSKVGSRG